jgi:hypothetical protein
MFGDVQMPYDLEVEKDPKEDREKDREKESKKDRETVEPNSLNRSR